MADSYDLILASSSPRRRDFMSKMGLSFEIKKPDADESVLVGENPQDYVKRIARDKAMIIAELNPHDIVLAADTVVVMGKEILGKPLNRDDAKRILRTLSGKTHEVMTAVCIMKNGEMRELFEVTKVTFAKLDEELIDIYVASGESDDKSGAYAVQGIGAMFIEKVEGSVSSVVGLPICQVREVLKDFGLMPRTVQAQLTNPIKNKSL